MEMFNEKRMFMSKVNLKDNIWIEGFDSEKEVYDITLIVDFDTCIWAGKTSDIPEEVAKECVKKHPNIYYMDYDVPSHIRIKDWTSNWTKITAKKSIQSACDKPYCIISKIN